jgi:hypothetical protein
MKQNVSLILYSPKWEQQERKQERERESGGWIPTVQRKTAYFLWVKVYDTV